VAIAVRPASAVKKWSIVVLAADPEWRLSATCPTCSSVNHWNLSPGTGEFEVWCHRDDIGATITLEQS
jgi:hypothetical protein